VVRQVGELDQIPVDGPILAQRYHEPDPGEADRKIYRIGDQIFGVKWVWPLRTYQDKYGEPFTVSSELRDIAQRCGDAFGLSLCGLDVVISEGQPYVVDINKFGSFIGVPDAPTLLADYIYKAAQRALKGESLILA
jgi:glutathione synthase/RimK-type ligase-like ATP-grasp enzyme